MNKYFTKTIVKFHGIQYQLMDSVDRKANSMHCKNGLFFDR